MDSPTLIGIHGVKGAGKDTTAQFIKDWAAESKPAPVVVKRGFADKAKWAFARQFFPTISMKDAIMWVDEHKDNQTAMIRGHRAHSVGEIPGPPQHLFHPIQFRQLMAQFSTESAREIYGGDFWVNQLLPRGNDPMWSNSPQFWLNWWHEFSYKPDENTMAPADFCLVTDVRFSEEIERVGALDGWRIKIKRADAEQFVRDEAERQGRKIHSSELGLPDEMFDIIINNNDNDMDNAADRTRCALGYIHRGDRRDAPLTIT